MIFYNNNETSNDSLYIIANHSYWHRCAYSCARYPREAVCISVLNITGGLTFTHAVILITIKTSFEWESLLKIGNAFFIKIHMYSGIQCSKS